MAQINIRDETRDRINKFIKEEPVPNPYTNITQDYIINKALNKLEGKEWTKYKNKQECLIT